MDLFLNKTLIYSCKYKDFYIIGNKFNGNFLFIPTLLYEKIEQSNYCFKKSNIIKKFYDEDKEYIDLLIDKMYEFDLLQKSRVDRINNNYISKVVIEITNRCNLFCKYCCMESNINEKEYLTLSDYVVIIEKIVSLNPDHIVISGGEPMLRDDIIDIIKYIRKKFDGYISLSTNLTVNIEKLIDISMYIDSIDVSLDGYDENSCSQYRGEGVFEIVDKNIDILKIYNNKISISMIVDDNNYKNITKFKSYCKCKGVKSTFKRFLAVGRGSEKNKFLHNKRNLVCMKLDEKLSINTCNAGITQIFVNNKGDIYPCPLMNNSKFFIGNIIKANKNEILKNAKIISNKINKEIYNSVNECEKCEFSIFCSPCPAIYNEVSKNLLTFDYYCKKRKEILSDKCNEYLNGVI